MAQTRERYRKLPGHRRGLFRGSSVWMGSDHLLLVKSVRFREEYKRFFLRDVQAIVVAERPRFHISTQSLGIAFLWGFPWLFYTFLPRGFPTVWWCAAAALVVTWLCFSAFFSCTCRLYTAVSNDELPSIYRTWTARRFLARVRPRIEEVQGALDPNWTAAGDLASLGPPAPAAAPGASPSEQGAAARSRTVASDVMIGSLLVRGILDFFPRQFAAGPFRWVSYLVVLIWLVSATAALVQHHRGILRAAMQKLAVVSIVVAGIGYYVSVGGLTAINFSRNAQLDERALVDIPAFILIGRTFGALNVLLAIAGIVIVLSSASRQPDIIKN